MEGVGGVHDDDAAARGWSPRQLHRLMAYMLGVDAAAAPHDADGALQHKLLSATAPAEGLVLQDRDARASELDALAGEAVTGSGAAAAPAADEGGRKRSSRFRGVTKHRRSGRYEAHVWVKATGKQLYLGGFEREEYAAEAFDIASLKAKGPEKARINFELSGYRELMPYLNAVSLDELVMSVRRQSQGFARGTSSYRGVTRHPNGRWEARLGVPGSRHIYLGLYVVEEEAARAYDRALVRLRGASSATNFAIADYPDELQSHKAERAPSEMPAQPTLEWPFEGDDLC